MPKPLFSLVIPTRERHRTLAYAMRSVLCQPFANFELIVQDNYSSDETWKTVRGFNTPRVKYNRTSYLMPMNENWEQALALCEGDYLFYMGDDDGVMPDGMGLAASILERKPLDVLMWEKFTYWWEDALEPTLAGRLFLHFSHGFQEQDPKAILEKHYRWEAGFGALPSIYTGFVKRALVDKVRCQAGQYFCVGAPDHFSGIANAYFAESVGRFERGLSVSGNSGASTGCSYFFRSRGEARRREYHREEGKSIAEIVHPSLIPSVNLEICGADIQARAKDLLFPDDGRFRVDPDAILRNMAANINRDPGSYDDTLADIGALAAKSNIDLSRISIPPRAADTRQEMQGLLAGADGQVKALAVNCRAAGVHDVAAAVRLASALLPKLTIN